MTERFAYPDLVNFPAHAGRVSVAHDATSATFSNVALSGTDWAGSTLMILPDDDLPYMAGVIAEGTPKGVYPNAGPLPLAWPYQGTEITDAKFCLVKGLGLADAADLAAIVAKFRTNFANNAGLVYDYADDPDESLMTGVAAIFDHDGRRLLFRRDGVTEQFPLNPDRNPRGKWTGNVASRFALSISGSPGEVAIDFEDGIEDEFGARYFSLIVDADAEIQLPTNAEANDIIDILFTQDGGGFAITFAAGYTVTDTVSTTDGARTRIRFTVTEVGGSPEEATELTGAIPLFALNDYVEDQGFNFLSNVDNNDDEPSVTAGVAASTASWTWVPAEKGEPGSALLTATSSSSVALEAGSKVFTLAEAEERGYALGSYVLAVDAANPTTKYGVGRVTAYEHPSLTLSFAADDIVGSGTIANWILSLTARRGAAGQQPGLLYEFSTTTTEGADPGTVRANNADISAGGELYIADQDATGEDHSAYWLEAANSTSAVKGFILIKRVQDGKVTQLRVSASPSDESGYVKFAYTYVSGPTSIAASSQISIKFDEKGDAGDGASVFTGLDDTPANYSGHGLKRVRVNSGATGLEFVEPGAEISGATEKTTPIDADTIGISDSEASGVFKKVTWANVKATLKTYFDTLYLTLAGLFTAGASQTLSDASTVAFNMDNGWNAKVTITDDRTLGNPTNVKNDISGKIEVTASGGARDLALDTAWEDRSGEFPITVPSGTTTDVLYYTRSDGTPVIAAVLPEPE